MGRCDKGGDVGEVICLLLGAADDLTVGLVVGVALGFFEGA